MMGRLSSEVKVVDVARSAIIRFKIERSPWDALGNYGDSAWTAPLRRDTIIPRITVTARLTKHDAAEPVAGGTSISPADENDPEKQTGCARQTHWRGRVLRYAKKTEMVERQRAEHLPQNDKGQNARCAKPPHH